MQSNNFIIKTAGRKQVDTVIDWAAQEGWNPGLYDADCYYQADSDGFLMGHLDGQPIAAISAINYSPSFGFLGFYIVKPEYRGKGYGMQIWNAGLHYLEGRNIGLDGVVAQQDNYKKSGFKLAYRNIRYQGCGGGEVLKNNGVVALSTLPFAMIDLYEQAFFPARRTEFIKSWINQPDSQALGIVQNEKLAGYGVIRRCRSGYKIGPLFADTPALAELLFLALKSTVSASELVYLDVPEVNQAAVSLAEKYAMQVSFETARMYTGSIPDMPMKSIFGVTSFEIG